MFVGLSVASNDIYGSLDSSGLSSLGEEFIFPSVFGVRPLHRYFHAQVELQASVYQDDEMRGFLKLCWQRLTQISVIWVAFIFSKSITNMDSAQASERKISW